MEAALWFSNTPDKLGVRSQKDSRQKILGKASRRATLTAKENCLISPDASGYGITK